MPTNDILEKYPWAVNAAKLARAITLLEAETRDTVAMGANGQQIVIPAKRKAYSEEEVQTLYVKFGGLLAEEGAEKLAEIAKYNLQGGIKQAVEKAAVTLKKQAAKVVKVEKKEKKAE